MFKAMLIVIGIGMGMSVGATLAADVDAGKVILFTFASDTVNSDYSINATVKYHIR